MSPLIETDTPQFKAWLDSIAKKTGDRASDLMDNLHEAVLSDHPVNISYVSDEWLLERDNHRDKKGDRDIFVLRGSIYDQPTIMGSKTVPLKILTDGRGELEEMFSSPWIVRDGLQVPQHVYRSGTDQGVTKAWHLHSVHTDQFVVPHGKLQVVMVDVRKGGPTFGHVNSIIMGDNHHKILEIPPGVLHGWKALSGPSVDVFNFQNRIYKKEDEDKFNPYTALTWVWEPKNG